ncbi:MAG TPA: CBS domain-containing protein [Gemmataceae bacterium]|nr:CBS domain-containing protein [Gemmataceae bacterium]
MNAMLETAPHLALQAETAAELMTANPVSVREDATLREAVNLLIDKGFSAAPVIDAAGRPVGVLSRSDLLIHDRETTEYLRKAPEYFHKEELHTSEGEMLGKGYQVEKVDRTCVRDLMTPAVFCVEPDATAARVVHDLLSLNVHRLFVVDNNGVLVGVISTFDVLRQLRP